MTLPSFGVELYLDGDLIDCEDYGNLTVATGIYGPIKQGSPHTCSVDVYSPSYDIGAYSEVQVVLTTPDPDDITAPPDCFTYDDGDVAKMCIFKGRVQARQGTGPNLGGHNTTRLSALGEESFIFNRRVAIAANPNSGYRAILENIMADVSEPDDGSLSFPTNATLQLDQPAIDGAVGATLNTLAGPYGIWATCQWLWDAGDDPDLTAIYWRPSHFSTVAGGVDTTYQQTVINQYHAWMLSWADVGMSWADNASTIRVKGETSGSVATSGSASSGAPLLYGKKLHTVTGWVDSDADCATAAGRLIDRLGDPNYDTVYDVHTQLDSYSKRHVTEGFTLAQANQVAIQWGSALPGDIIQWFNNDTGAASTSWPTSNPDAASLEDEFELVLGFAKYSTVLSEITGTRWDWDNASGWTVHHSLAPKD